MTGGAGALALASARALLEHGLSGIALLDLPRSLEKSVAAIESLRSEFPAATILTESCDVTDAPGMQAVVQRLVDCFGEPNILCCFAGMVNCVRSEEMTVDEWRRVIDVNTTGSWIAAQAVGKCVTTSST